MNDKMSQKATLVLGASGKTGSRVTHRLQALGHDIRPVSRSTDPRFDWTDPDSWPAALTGCDAAYVTYQPDVAIPGADEVIGRFATAAVAAGCRRLVLLSGRGEEGARRAEQAFIASGAEWTPRRRAGSELAGERAWARPGGDLGRCECGVAVFAP